MNKEKKENGKKGIEKKGARIAVAAVAAAAIVASVGGVLLHSKASEVTPEEASELGASILVSKLSAEGSDTIEFMEDVYVADLLYVNGDKTLTGSGKILTETGLEYIIVVNEGASLTIDGITVDGLGNSTNGIYVSPNASFDMESGSINNLTGHGVRVLGEGEFNGGAIDSTGTNWIMLDEGANLSISGGKYSSCGDIGVLTGASSNAVIGGDAAFSGSESYLVYNGGNMEVTGGSYSDCGNYFYHNDGELEITDVDFTGADSLGYIENGEGGTANMQGGSMKDSLADFVYNQGSFSATGVTFDNCPSTAIETRGGSSVLKLTDCSLENIGKNGILATSGSVEAKNVSIGDCGACGIRCKGADFTGENVTVNYAGDIAFFNDSVSDSNLTVGTFSVDGFEIGSSKSYCIRTNGGLTSLSNGTVGKGDSYGLYIKSGEVELDTVSFLGTNDTERNVIQVGLSSSPAGKLTMDNCTVTGGTKGVTNHGEFTFNSGEIYGNATKGTATGAGVFNTGTMVMNGGKIHDNVSAGSGGGIANKGTLTITGGSIYSNMAKSYGGGIYCSGEMHMNGGTVSGNYAVKGGGGVEVTGKAYINKGYIKSNSSGNGGGGLYVGKTGYVIVSDAEISKNTTSNGKSGGGISNAGGQVILNSGAVVRSNTSDGNGGGIYNYGILNINGGTIDNNYAAGNGGAIANSSYTADDGTIYAGVTTIESGEFYENTAMGYGGAFYNATHFHMNGGTARNNYSVKGGGGLETNGAAVVNGSIINNTTGGGGGGCYVGSKGTLEVRNANISGNSSGDGKSGGGISIAGGTVAVYPGAVISGNTASSNGGGIYNYGDLTIVGGTISNNVATGYTDDSGQHNGNGGGVSNSSYTSDSGTKYVGSFTMYGGVITGNKSYNNGGGLYNACSANISGGEITYNEAANAGGGIYISGSGSATISGLAICNNKTTTKSGGGLSNAGGSVAIASGTIITGNSAAANGGGINNYGNMTICGAVISNNAATANGGGIAVTCYSDYVGTLSLSDTVMQSNTADKGGALYQNGTTVNLYDNSISSCTSTSGGGGVYATGGATVNLNSGSITDCGSNGNGGAVYIHTASKLLMTGGTVSSVSGSSNTLYFYKSGDGVVSTISGGIVYGKISRATSSASAGNYAVTGGSFSEQPSSYALGKGKYKATKNSETGLWDVSAA